MNLRAEDRHVLNHLVLAVIFGCLVLLLFGCHDRTSTTSANPQKVVRPVYSNNVVSNKITTGTKQYVTDSEWPTGLTPEQQENNGYGTRIADTTITRSVNATLRQDAQLAHFNFEVATVNGEVTLKGETSSVELRMLTERLAATQRGVTKVNNFVRVTWNN